MKDKQISEDELLDELDTMYQRVADIEREEAAQEIPPPSRMKPKQQKKKRPYRTIIVIASVLVVISASVLAITVFDPMALLERLNISGIKLPMMSTSPAPGKPSKVPPSPATPNTSAVATSENSSKSSATISSPPPASSSATPSPNVSAKVPSEPRPQARQEPIKKAPEEPIKTKPQEIAKASKPAPRGKYYSIQIGAFRDMENVRELVAAFKKEDLEAYWITVKNKGSGSFHRVLVGQFAAENEAAAFLKDNRVFNKYPGSFVKEVSPSKINHE